MVGNIGFEPIQREATDLQSAPALQLRRLPLKHKHTLYFIFRCFRPTTMLYPDMEPYCMLKTYTLSHYVFY
jgi:hypothetical protein